MKQKMKAFVVDGDGNLRFDQIPIPRPKRFEALVKLVSCGICNGTDSKIIHRNFKGIDEYPVILGHEGVGEVVELGEDVTHLKVGDLVLLPFIGTPPEGYHSAWGTFAEYNVVTDYRAMLDAGLDVPEFSLAQNVLPQGFDPISSAMIITLREVYSTMGIFGFEAGKSLAVLGLGPVGLSFVRLAKLIGMSPIIAMDIDDEKLALARKLGADYTLNTRDIDLPREIRKIHPDGIDFALDAVGYNPFINDAMTIVKPGTKICVYGISPKMTHEIDWSKNDYNWTLQFNQFPSKRLEGACHDRIISWINEGLLDPSFFISHVIDFDDIISAYEMIDRREKMLKMVVKFR